MDIHTYHWIFYCLGFLFAPRLTIMIWISLYGGHLIPLPLMIIGWICSLGITIEKKK